RPDDHDAALAPERTQVVGTGHGLDASNRASRATSWSGSGSSISVSSPCIPNAYTALGGPPRKILIIATKEIGAWNRAYPCCGRTLVT
ncbi:hypothetical protein, partial [Streptomyces sp. NPDC001076]